MGISALLLLHSSIPRTSGVQSPKRGEGYRSGYLALIIRSLVISGALNSLVSLEKWYLRYLVKGEGPQEQGSPRDEIAPHDTVYASI